MPSPILAVSRASAAASLVVLALSGCAIRDDPPGCSDLPVAPPADFTFRFEALDYGGGDGWFVAVERAEGGGYRVARGYPGPIDLPEWGGAWVTDSVWAVPAEAVEPLWTALREAEPFCLHDAYSSTDSGLYDGGGVRIGIVAGGRSKRVDLDNFWPPGIERVWEEARALTGR